MKVLDEGSYMHYDFITADMFLLVMGNLLERYGSSHNKITVKLKMGRIWSAN